MQATGIVEIDLSALARNYGVLARAAAPGDCGAVVKADAYGLGVAPVARALEAAGCRHFFVATPSEGVELRASFAADTFAGEPPRPRPPLPAAACPAPAGGAPAGA